MVNICPSAVIIAAVIFALITHSFCFQWTTSSPADGAVIQACIREKVSFPWEFSTSADETIENVQWHKRTGNENTLIATRVADFFLKIASVNITVEFLPNAGITISNHTFEDFGTFSVKVIYRQQGSFFSASRSAILALPDAPIISGNRLVAHVQREPVTDLTTGEKHVQVSCGDFLERGSRPVSVVWRTPSGETVPSTSFSHGEFHLTLPNPVVGGSYVCRLEDPSFAARCVKNMSALRRGAHVVVDEVQTRLLLLEDGVQGLQDKDQAVDDELERLEEKDTNLTSRDEQLQKELLLLEDGVQGLQDKDQAVDDELERLEEKDTNLTSRDDQLQGELLLLKDGMQSVQDRQQQVATDLRSRDESLTADVTDLRQDLASDVSGLREELSQQEADMNQLQTQMNEREGLSIILQQLQANWTADIKRLEDSIRNLEEESHRHCMESNWKRFQSSCYLPVKEKLAWSAAKERCRQAGGKLVEIETPEENVFIKALALEMDTANGFAWMGGTDSAAEGEWVWDSNGNSLTVKGWGSREPNNSGGEENCLMTRKIGWNDSRCFSEHFSICEMSQD